MNLASLLEAAVARAPERPAAMFADSTLTYGALSSRAFGAAQALSGCKRVALIARESPASLAAFWGAQWSGVETVDVPLHVGGETIAAMVAESGADAVVWDEAAKSSLSSSEIAAPGFDVEVITRAARSVPRVERDPKAVAHTIYTSGTTGSPKGVMLTHENLISNVSAAAERMPSNEGDSLLVVVPMFFIHGRMQLLAHTRVAGTLCFSRGFRFPKQVLEELEKWKVTGMSGVPFHFATLLTKTRLAETPLPNLRYILVTGGALERRMADRLRRALPEVEVHTAYGSTEASPRICHASPRELAAYPRTSGRALPGITVAIRARDGLDVPSGSLGEVVCRGPNVMAGYVSGDEVTSGRIDADGWLHTGDLGRVDAEGYLYLSGRLSDMIKTAGERVFPREIEAVLERHSAVLEAAVVGVPDSVLGERIIAAVVLRPGTSVSANALLLHARSWLPFVRSPREVYVVEALPKTASSKLRRNELVATLETLRGRVSS